VKETIMGIEGPHDSPEGAPPTGILATEPLPPGGEDIRKIVDAIDQRIRELGPQDVEQADESADEPDTPSREGDPVAKEDTDEQSTDEPTD
jgi:hypothetical protein